MVEAHLTAAGGDYGASSSLIVAVAEAEPDEVARRELLAVAALYAERAGEPGEGRGTPYAVGTAQGREATVGNADGLVLSVYPNPSRDRMTVALSLDAASDVRVAVFDVLGRRVATLAEGRYEAGAHRLAFDASVLPAGVYVIRAAVGDARVLTQRLTVIR